MNSLLRLDGGTATELQRAGLPVAAPWWTTLAVTTEARRTLLRQVHESYIAAGADIITAATFRCNLRALRELGLDEAGHAWMVHAAVGVAKAAVGGANVTVAASMAPVQDCFRPDLVPPDDELEVEHRWLATELMRVGADLVMIETMNTAREARIALDQVQRAGGRAFVSFACGAGGTLLSGEPLGPAARDAERDGAEAVLVNCTTPARTEAALAVLSDACSGPVGAYPNLEDRTGTPDGGTASHAEPNGASGNGGGQGGEISLPPAALTPDQFAALVTDWRERFGAEVIGGCCGSTPGHLAAAYAALASTTA